MKKLYKIAIDFMLVLAFICSVFGFASLNSEPSKIKATSNAIEYLFSGAEKDLAGYAEGKVKITCPTSSGYCHLYWANDAGVLTGYEKIVTLSVTSTQIEYDMPDNMLLPSGATKLAVFFSTSETLSSTALANAEIYSIPQLKQFNSGELEMSFASVSDVHVNYNGAPALWTSALNYFDEIGLEMVVVSGDITNNGLQTEYETYTASVEASSYPADKIYVSRGNHDSQQNANYIQYTSQSDMVRPTDDSPWFYVLKEGEEGQKDNLFIFLAQELSGTGSSHTQDNFSSTQLDWFEGVLQTYAGTNTNIFVVEHGYFHNWGPGDRYDGVYVQPMKIKDSYTGNLRFQRLLMEYKEIVSMSGHSHIAYSEMVNYSDEKGTACRMLHNSSTSQPRVYNAEGTVLVYGNGGSEGYVVNVYENDIVYNGTNLLTKEKIPTACYIFSSYSEDRSEATAIEITSNPKKTTYEAGEYFNAYGLEVTATFADGSKRVVQGWGLESNTSLSEQTTSVGIVYGDLKVDLPIRMGSSIDLLEGDGSYQNPYLIQTPEDFIILTKCFKSITGQSSNDANVFGKDKYFLQTADLDMTDYADYKGTDASGNQKYGFSGVYNGGGHTIKVGLNSTTSNTSVFPYVNGVVMNVNFEGYISCSTYAQPIRTVGSNGKIINCSSNMTLTSNTSCGLSLSNYGEVIRYFSNNTVNGSSGSYVFAKTNSGCSYIDCYYDGGLSDSNGVKVTNYDEVSEQLSLTTSESATRAVQVLQAISDTFSLQNIASWENMKLSQIMIEHVCTFDREVISEANLASEANCLSATLYYKSCICGLNGNETFASGEINANNHSSLDFTYSTNNDGTHNKLHACCQVLDIENEACEYSEQAVGIGHSCLPANCQTATTYYKSCLCGKNGVETFTSGEIDANNHTSSDFTYSTNNDGTHNKLHACCQAVAIANEACDCQKEVADQSYLISEATCTTIAKYYKSCICGERGEDTFTSGEVNAENHASQEFVYTINSNGTHKKLHACCGALISDSENCSFNGGDICAFCNYDKTPLPIYTGDDGLSTGAIIAIAVSATLLISGSVFTIILLKIKRK